MKCLALATLLSACATMEKRMENRDLEQLYQGAGVERYFLPDLPVWANFSSASGCRRDVLVRYLNFATIRSSYSLDYESIVHLQHMVNRRLAASSQGGEKQLYLKDEAFIFYNVYEQVSGGSRDFLAPQFNRVSLVWIDPYLDTPKTIEKILESDQVGQGHPVLVSSCLSSKKMEEMMEKNGWDRFGVKLVSSEMFSPYTGNLELGSDFILDFSLFFPNKETRLFVPGGKAVKGPSQFKGINRVIEL